MPALFTGLIVLAIVAIVWAAIARPRLHWLAFTDASQTPVTKIRIVRKATIKSNGSIISTREMSRLLGDATVLTKIGIFGADGRQLPVSAYVVSAPSGIDGIKLDPDGVFNIQWKANAQTELVIQLKAPTVISAVTISDNQALTTNLALMLDTGLTFYSFEGTVDGPAKVEWANGRLRAVQM